MGPISLLIRLRTQDFVLENLLSYFIETIVACILFFIVMYKTGLQMNAKTKTQSMAGPIGDQIIAVAVQLILSLITKFSYVVNPYAGMLAIVFWSNGNANYSPRQNESILKMLGLSLMQMIFFSIVSLGAFALAKYYQEHKNPVLNKIRVESRPVAPSAGEFDLSDFELNLNGKSKKK